MEIQFSSDQDNHGAHGCESCLTLRLAFGRLEQSVEGFEKAIGLAGLSPRPDPVEMLPNHSGYLHLGLHYLCAPLPQHSRHDMNLFAGQNLPQVFSIQPGGKT